MTYIFELTAFQLMGIGVALAVGFTVIAAMIVGGIVILCQESFNRGGWCRHDRPDPHKGGVEAVEKTLKHKFWWGE